MVYPGPTLDNVVFSNTTNLTINSLSFVATDGTATILTINANTISMASNSTGTNLTLIINATHFYVGNSTSNVFANTTTDEYNISGFSGIQNATTVQFTGNSTGVNATGSLNAYSLYLGANTGGNTVINSIAISVGLANVVINTAGVFVANSTGVV